MKVHQMLCPECGEPARGTVEPLSVVAEFAGEPQTGDDVEYSGSTEVWWDEQRTVHEEVNLADGPAKLPLVCCHNGHAWPTTIDWESCPARPAEESEA